jgi:hypothetical protein
MPRTETVLQVFVASPADLTDERRALDETITELNATWARSLGVRLDLWRWETSAYPGAAADPQAVINSEAPVDYDVFVGIMWARFGTPTPRAGSGTEEEFRSAKARHDANPSSVHVMFYFKETPVSPRLIDPAQLSAVSAFRASLGEEGVLYWPFDSTEQFRAATRLHLTRVVQSFLAQHAPAARPALVGPVPSSGHALSVPTPAPTDPEPLADEEGLLDLLDTATTALSRLTAIASHMNDSIVVFGDRISKRSAALNAVDKTDSAAISIVKRVDAAAAEDLDEFTARTNLETPTFLETLQSAMDALSRAAAVSLDFPDSGGNLRIAAATAAQVRDGLLSALPHMKEFRDTVFSAPRLTTRFNRSKRRAVSALDALLSAFAQGEVSCARAERSILELLEPEH